VYIRQHPDIVFEYTVILCIYSIGVRNYYSPISVSVCSPQLIGMFSTCSISLFGESERGRRLDNAVRLLQTTIFSSFIKQPVQIGLNQ
jgi:hypothetical protein